MTEFFQVYYEKLQSSVHKDRLSQQKCLFTDKVKINGIIFVRGMWLPDVPDDGNRKVDKVKEICDFVSLGLTNIEDMFVICKTYKTFPNEHYASYCIDKSSLYSKFAIINIADYIEKHHYPVKAYNIGEELMFRCKRF